MPKSRPQPPRPDRRRSIRGSFSWIDHRFLREGFDQGPNSPGEKLLYFVLVGGLQSRWGELLLRRAFWRSCWTFVFPTNSKRPATSWWPWDLIAYAGGILPGAGSARSLFPERAMTVSCSRPDHTPRSSPSLSRPVRRKRTAGGGFRIWRASSSC